jgi:hypothetical protein
MALEGITMATVFETYVKHVLAPHLKQGQAVVMDNLRAHEPKRIREQEAICEVLSGVSVHDARGSMSTQVTVRSVNYCETCCQVRFVASIPARLLA